jgi:hypothetical protein
MFEVRDLMLHLLLLLLYLHLLLSRFKARRTRLLLLFSLHLVPSSQQVAHLLNVNPNPNQPHSIGPTSPHPLPHMHIPWDLTAPQKKKSFEQDWSSWTWVPSLALHLDLHMPVLVGKGGKLRSNVKVLKTSGPFSHWLVDNRLVSFAGM